MDEKIISSLVLQGDISKMSSTEKVDYYKWLCESLGLNPATQPFEIIKFQGKERLYAKKDATDQLRKIHGISVVEKKIDDTFKEQGLYVVNVKVKDKEGREDLGTGVVNINGLKGEALANALMKTETKAKRRATLSICGLGMLDESELDTIGTYKTQPIESITHKVEAINNINVLMKLYKELGTDDQKRYKALFTDRKEKIFSMKALEVSKIQQLITSYSEPETLEDEIEGELDKLPKSERGMYVHQYVDKLKEVNPNREFAELPY